MVEATDFANRDDPAEVRLLNWPTVGRILVERQVSARPVVSPGFVPFRTLSTYVAARRN
jgi:hypothetical protein